MSDKFRKILPRDAAGSFSFPPEAGKIQRMVSVNGSLEVYTAKATYKLKSPDCSDPGRTIPNMPWSQSASSVGASNMIVARIFLQSVDALANWHFPNCDIEKVKHHLHVCKEEALICEAAYKDLKPDYDSALMQINGGKLAIKKDMIECPNLPRLKESTTSFLAAAKRAIQAVGEVFNEFYAFDGQKPRVSNGNFNFAIARLVNGKIGNENLLKFLQDNEVVIKRFVDLRNGLEHPHADDATLIEDFRLTPQGISVPTWKRGSLVSEGNILDEMAQFIGFIIWFSEHVFFFGLLDGIDPRLPMGFEVKQLAESEIDADCPIRLRLNPYFGD